MLFHLHSGNAHVYMHGWFWTTSLKSQSQIPAIAVLQGITWCVRGKKIKTRLQVTLKLSKSPDSIKMQNVSRWQWTAWEYALLIWSSQVSLCCSLSISSLWCLWGIREDLSGVFQWQVGKICSQQKAFPKPKTPVSTMLTFTLMECFPWKTYLQAFRYCSLFLMSQISGFTPCGFYNAYLNNIGMLSQWGSAQHGALVSLFM